MMLEAEAHNERYRARPRRTGVVVIAVRGVRSMSRLIFVVAAAARLVDVVWNGPGAPRHS
jgi:hypothetical protein